MLQREWQPARCAMNDLYRIVDANINRVSEGLRVLEDTARLHLNDKGLCAATRSLRHRTRELGAQLGGACLAARSAETDVGLAVSREAQDNERTSLSGLVTANFKRVQEGLRVLEETLRLLGHRETAKEYELLRFEVYSLEPRYAPLLRQHRAASLLDTDLYGITAEEHSRGRSNVQVVAEMLAAGIRLIQYREKRKAFAERYWECREIRRLTRETGAILIVNDHPELALMAQADGVHLGQEDYPPEAVRALIGEEMLIGVSTHSPTQARDAVARGADYIGVGPIYPTLTKGTHVDPVGLDYLDYVVANVSIPFVALGGITASNVREVGRHGARLVAMAKEIVSADDIGAKVAEIREAFALGRTEAEATDASRSVERCI